ncbi:fimbrin/plastin [Anaeramoeba flamelloides]|uniref:Fimbrin/plastin n=1 Tax=Anaeramoeba flamelloides TaxID=1746091 RepID=A0AAV7Z6C7_9EUKA|nr:fimbrin/plastin [Anaeramoeba flamelloides]
MEIPSYEELEKYIEFINTTLENNPIISRILPINLTNLFLVIQDGELITVLLNHFFPGIINEEEILLSDRKTKEEKIKNYNLCFEAMKEIGLEVEITDEDFLKENNPKIKKFLWKVIEMCLFEDMIYYLLNNKEIQEKYEVDPLIEEPKEILLKWLRFYINKSKSELEINNFGKELNDGIIYLTILKEIIDEAINYLKEEKENKKMDQDLINVINVRLKELEQIYIKILSNLKENELEKVLNLIIEIANFLGCSEFVSQQDIQLGNERMNIAFCISLFQKSFINAIQKDTSKKIQKLQSHLESLQNKIQMLQTGILNDNISNIQELNNLNENNTDFLLNNNNNIDDNKEKGIDYLLNWVNRCLSETQSQEITDFSNKFNNSLLYSSVLKFIFLQQQKQLENYIEKTKDDSENIQTQLQNSIEAYEQMELVSELDDLEERAEFILQMAQDVLQIPQLISSQDIVSGSIDLNITYLTFLNRAFIDLQKNTNYTLQEKTGDILKEKVGDIQIDLQKNSDELLSGIKQEEIIKIFDNLEIKYEGNKNEITIEQLIYLWINDNCIKNNFETNINNIEGLIDGQAFGCVFRTILTNNEQNLTEMIKLLKKNEEKHSEKIGELNKLVKFNEDLFQILEKIFNNIFTINENLEEKEKVAIYQENFQNLFSMTRKLNIQFLAIPEQMNVKNESIFYAFAISIMKYEMGKTKIRQMKLDNITLQEKITLLEINLEKNLQMRRKNIEKKLEKAKNEQNRHNKIRSLLESQINNMNKNQTNNEMDLDEEKDERLLEFMDDEFPETPLEWMNQSLKKNGISIKIGDYNEMSNGIGYAAGLLGMLKQEKNKISRRIIKISKRIEEQQKQDLPKSRILPEEMIEMKKQELQALGNELKKVDLKIEETIKLINTPIDQLNKEENLQLSQLKGKDKIKKEKDILKLKKKEYKNKLFQIAKFLNVDHIIDENILTNDNTLNMEICSELFQTGKEKQFNDHKNELLQDLQEKLFISQRENDEINQEIESLNQDLNEIQTENKEMKSQFEEYKNNTIKELELSQTKNKNEMNTLLNQSENELKSLKNDFQTKIDQINEQIENIEIEFESLKEIRKDETNRLAEEKNNALENAQDLKEKAVTQLRGLLERTEKDGYLEILEEGRIGGRQKWKRRYFLLRDNVVTWYIDAKPKRKPLGMFLTDKARIYRDIVKKETKKKKVRPHSFEVHEGGDKYVFVASSDDEKNEWVLAFTKSKKLAAKTTHIARTDSVDLSNEVGKKF